ncbi:hypothetical protein NDU88_005100 [Pleurodeles waltl]|uniref:Uncharacterized protein n=1 Tax=Pleurodeles waltl TaxID=8319 RepID=A0AAV7WAI9_PLEWA|nr:hypothetical protein NDU88_005100 [Pleurodeles waltl]
MGEDVKYPWGTPLNAGPCLHPARPDGIEVLGGDTPRPGRREASEGRARRRKRVLEEREETQRGAARLERTEGEQKVKGTEGGHHTEPREEAERESCGRGIQLHCWRSVAYPGTRTGRGRRCNYRKGGRRRPGGGGERSGH